MRLTEFNIDDEPDLEMDFRDNLKHTSDFDDMSVPYFDRLAVLVNEGIATEDEKREYHRLVYQNENLKKEADTYKACYLDPDDKIDFPDKESLRRKPRTIALWGKIAAAAAVIGVCVMVGTNLSNNDKISADFQPIVIADNSPADNTPNNEGANDNGDKPKPASDTIQTKQKEEAPVKPQYKMINMHSRQLVENEETPQPENRGPIFVSASMEGERWMPTATLTQAGPDIMVAKPQYYENTAELPAIDNGNKLTARIKTEANERIKAVGNSLARMGNGIAKVGQSVAELLPIKVRVNRNETGEIEGWDIEALSRTLVYSK